MQSFSLLKGSPVTLEEMQEKLVGWEFAATLLLTKRHFGKDATLRINRQVCSTFADVRAIFCPDLPEEYLEWDKLIASAEVNPIWASRNEEKRKKAMVAGAVSVGTRTGNVPNRMMVGRNRAN